MSGVAWALRWFLAGSCYLHPGVPGVPFTSALRISGAS